MIFCISRPGLPDSGFLKKLLYRRRGLITILGLFLFMVLLVGCMAPAPPPPQNQTYSPTELKYILLDHYNESRFFSCDPDAYPVSHGNEIEKAVAAFPGIRNNSSVFNAIITRKGLLPPYTNESKLVIYREYKKLNALHLASASTDTYEFSLNLQEPTGGMQVTGIIRNDGVILEQNIEPAILTCPICLTEGTLIDTPNGRVAVEGLKIGMTVWTTNVRGSRIAAPILAAGKVPIPPGYPLTRIILSDGRELTSAPGHPTIDDRTIGMLQPGDGLDGAVVTSSEEVISAGQFTWDILPAGGTGIYWGNGIPVKSTLSSGA
jgi:hypothetical protein